MPTVGDFIQRAKDRKDDFIQSIYPIGDLHVRNSGNNKHIETLDSLGLYKGLDVLNLINSQAKLAQTNLDIYGYSRDANYKWQKYDVRSHMSISVSEYIAYDTLSPPNPFIAVTDDGVGRVVYDGGFPKIYNMRAPAAGQTTPYFKYVTNAINWVLNPKKVAQGNRKVLFIGDTSSTNNYKVKGTGVSDFNTSIQRLIELTNATGSVIKDPTDYPSGTLELPYSELSQYAAVFFIGAWYSPSMDVLPDSAVSNLVRFKEEGGGIVLITDHGPTLKTIQEAERNRVGFFSSVNKVAIAFGAWFSGDYDRTAVNVGFLRRTYGDHPLYAGMTDNESIYGGSSESRVFLSEGSSFMVREHKCYFGGQEYTVKSSLLSLAAINSNWDNIRWNLSLKLYPGRGYAMIEPTVNYQPETTHLVHIGTWKYGEGFDVDGHVRMFNFKMDS